jgi:HTH-type transcriptional regulator, sugar sensing transcriptional regulator
MTAPMDYSLLKEAGLTEGEVKVYLALLKHGSSTVGPIIEESGVARSFVYHILDSLIEKALVSYITKEKTKYYQAAQPQKILDYIDERKEQLKKNRAKVEAFLPQLALLQASAKASTVNVYEGFKGVITVFERQYEKLGKGDEYYFMGIDSTWGGYQESYWMKDHKRRIAAGIKVKLLFHRNTPKRFLDVRNNMWGADARYMPLAIDSPAWFFGYKDVTVIGLQQNPIAIEIVNEEIAVSFRNYFDSFWEQTKKL